MLATLLLAVTFAQSEINEGGEKYPISPKVANWLAERYADRGPLLAGPALTSLARQFYVTGNEELALVFIDKIEPRITSFRYAKYREEKNVKMLLRMLELYDNAYYKVFPDYIEEALFERDRESLRAVAKRIATEDDPSFVWHSFFPVLGKGHEVTQIEAFCDLLAGEGLTAAAVEVALEHVAPPVASVLLLEWAGNDIDAALIKVLVENRHRIDPAVLLAYSRSGPVRDACVELLLTRELVPEGALYDLDWIVGKPLARVVESLVKEGRTETLRAIWKRHKEHMPQLVAEAVHDRFEFYDLLHSAGLKELLVDLAEANKELFAAMEPPSGSAESFAYMMTTGRALYAYVLAGEKDKVEEIKREAAARGERTARGLTTFRVSALAAIGRYEEAISESKEEPWSEPELTYQFLFVAAANRGDKEHARKFLAELIESAGVASRYLFDGIREAILLIDGRELYLQLIREASPADPTNVDPDDALNLFATFALVGDEESAALYIGQMIKAEMWWIFVFRGMEPGSTKGPAGSIARTIHFMEHQGRPLIDYVFEAGLENGGYLLSDALSALRQAQYDPEMAERMFGWYERAWKNRADPEYDHARTSAVLCAVSDEGIPLTPYWQERILELVRPDESQPAIEPRRKLARS